MCASSFITYGYGPLIVIITGAHLPRRILYLYLRFFIFLCYSNGEGDEKSFDFSEKLNIEFSNLSRIPLKTPVLSYHSLPEEAN